uniref:Uncharacterized protein n=1 Tax=Lygus hesperus TaxID=30085 RepID=A0A146LNA7_LYGHE
MLPTTGAYHTVSAGPSCYSSTHNLQACIARSLSLYPLLHYYYYYCCVISSWCVGAISVARIHLFVRNSALPKSPTAVLWIHESFTYFPLCHYYYYTYSVVN